MLLWWDKLLFVVSGVKVITKRFHNRCWGHSMAQKRVAAKNIRALSVRFVAPKAPVTLNQSQKECVLALIIVYNQWCYIHMHCKTKNPVNWNRFISKRYKIIICISCVQTEENTTRSITRPFTSLEDIKSHNH